MSTPRPHTLRTLAVAAALAFLAGVVTAAPTSATVASVATVYTVPPPPSGTALRAPVITAYDSSNLVVGWRNQVNFAQDDAGDALVAWSDNGGTSWSAPITLKSADSTYSYVNVLLYKDPASTSIYAYIGRVPTGQVPDNMTLIAMRSTDKGKTWADVALTMNYANPTITGGQIYKNGSTYLMPFHNLTPGGQGVLKSSNLTTWDLAAFIPNPSGVRLQEGSIAPANDVAGRLVMVMRVEGDYAYTSLSSDGGSTWSTPVQDTNLPSLATKGYFATSALGAYVAVTSNDAVSTGSTNTDRRTALTYQVKWPYQPWSGKRFFSDIPADSSLGGYGPGWDTYPQGVEVAPGKFAVVWEYGTVSVKVATLDITNDPYGTTTEFDTLNGWAVSGSNAQISPASQLNLNNSSGTPVTVGWDHGPMAGPYTVNYRAKVDAYTANDPVNGVSLGVKVATGSRRLMIAHQSDGVWAITTASAPNWSRVYTGSGDTAFHNWRADVDSAGVVTLTRDGTTLATWTAQTSTAPVRIEAFATGTATQPAQSHLDALSVSPSTIEQPWDSITGWVPNKDTVNGTINPASQLLLQDQYTNRQAGPSLPFVAEMRARVEDFTVNAPATGTSLGYKVDTGKQRLMLAIQADGVYAITSTSSGGWVKVYGVANDTSWHTWTVRVNPGAVGELFKDGVSTGATWTLQDSARGAVVGHWSDGTPADAALARVDYTSIR